MEDSPVVNDTQARTVFTLQGNERYDWITGRALDGCQILIGLVSNSLLCVRFRPDGCVIDQTRRSLAGESHASTLQILHNWSAKILVKKTAIHVREFVISEVDVALRQWPEPYREFIESPWSYDEEERAQLASLVNEWRERDRFVIHWRGEHWCCCDGLVHE